MNVLQILLTALLALLGFGGSTPTPPAEPDDPQPPAESVVRPLTVGDALAVADGPDGTKVLRTTDGRAVQLRGANVNTFVDYGGVRKTVPVTPVDGTQARALGFSVIRLAVSWSAIEPQPGQFDQAYLDRVRDAARIFADQGLYVLLDMHQDRFGAGLIGGDGGESDGAPTWAAKTGGASTAPGSSDGHPYYVTGASRAAATAFFRNETVAGKPLQEHYADAVQQIAAVGQDLGPAFAGVELYNEPVDPESTSLTGDTFSASRLWPFYNRVISRLRSGGYTAPIWFEPVATRTQNDRDPAAARFSDDAGLVYGPHIYTNVYSGSNDSGTPGRIVQSFQAAADEARKYHAALTPTELPGASTGPWEAHRTAVLGQLDALNIGGMVWVWKQHPDYSYGWGVLNADGSVRGETPIATGYGRARVQASGPRVVSTVWQDGTLTVKTSGAGPVDLWDGAAFAGTAPATGVSKRIRVDGVLPATGTVRAWNATSTLQSSSAWVGGRQLRVTVPAGEHTIVLRP
ncbi:cellulase family glycosylhydrolase [Patulibacter sp. NPDC049589]|uniref:glycoside hydrolase family 5 protein n=1 Tax=Patulibacter sp. NPDC049589 TaxID=3154731 RepID=UPI0034330EE8